LAKKLCVYSCNYYCCRFKKKLFFPDQSKNIQIPHNTKRGRKSKTKKALNKQKDLELSRSFKSDSESRSTDTSEYLERVIGKRRCRSDEDINAFDGSIDNYEDNLSVIQNFAIENVINNNKASAHVAVADDNVADNNDNDNDDDDDIIIEKFVGGKLGKTVKVGKTRMSKGFYQYTREKIKIKKEKELILESESTGRLKRSKKK
jgi:hypothetical protein